MKLFYESKSDALLDIFIIENVADRWYSKTIDVFQFLDVISRKSYNLSKDLNISHGTVTKILSRLWPDRSLVKTNGKLCNYLFAKYKLRHCTTCESVQSEHNFHNNVNKLHGKDCYCKPCYNILVKDYRRSYEAIHRASKLNATPVWANLSRIKEIYETCPVGSHVDHIIPLIHPLVCGLHVHENLQHLTAEENLKKSNKFTPG